jgi:sec-independent protein translocase protein TatA
MFGMGAPELLIVLLLVVLLFGASKIPELGKSLGSGLSNFKRGLKEAEREERETAEREKDANNPIRVEAKTSDPASTSTATSEKRPATSTANSDRDA